MGLELKVIIIYEDEIIDKVYRYYERIELFIAYILFLFAFNQNNWDKKASNKKSCSLTTHYSFGTMIWTVK